MASALSLYKATLQRIDDNDLIPKSHLLRQSFSVPQYFADLMDLMMMLAFLHISHDVHVMLEKMKV